MGEADKGCSRRQFLGTIGAAAAGFAFTAGCSSEQLKLGKSTTGKPRNVIFILSDDHRYDFMGFMGKPKFLETPNMDKMARQGAHIQNAFVTTALCSPSRASVLTGQYSHKHGVIDNNSRVPKGTIFFPQYLQKTGYETAFIGKWHMGRTSSDPRPGFDKWISFRGQGDYYDPVLNIDGAEGKVKGYVTDLLTDYALEWLKKERDKPFFLYLSHKAVHGMFEPAKRHLGKYDNVPLEYPSTMADTEENYKGKPGWVKEQRNSWHGVDYMYHGRMDYDVFYRRYCEALLGVDESIGRVLDYLEKAGLAESTLVFYMGDNGFSFGEHGLIDKRHMYEESMRVPLLAYCPGLIKAGTTVSQMVQNIDIAPTILEAAGLKTPDYMDGRSFLGLLAGKEVAWRDAVFYEYYWEWNYPQTPTVHGVRTDRYKYMHYHGIWDIDELYDLQNDPDEMYNLINSPEHQELVKKLNSMVFAWLEETDGMKISIRRYSGYRGDKRRPAK
ncbi:MAG: sulfatase family protein [Planctomycetota bacterium]|jgi:arylsulfatase A-like enzyme